VVAITIRQIEQEQKAEKPNTDMVATFKSCFDLAKPYSCWLLTSTYPCWVNCNSYGFG